MQHLQEQLGYLSTGVQALVDGICDQIEVALWTG